MGLRHQADSGLPVDDSGLRLVDDPFAGLEPSRAARSRTKRLADIAASAVGLGLVSPVALVIGLGVRWTSPGPILYKQERVGLCGRSFEVWKFRTMQNGADDQLNDLLANSHRATDAAIQGSG